MEVPLVALPAEERKGTLHEFTNAHKEGRVPQSSGKDNLRSLALVYAAVQSAESGGDRIHLPSLRAELV
jgi:hypothetical protein